MNRETGFTQSRKVRKARKENQGLLLRASLRLGVSCFNFFKASLAWAVIKRPFGAEEQMRAFSLHVAE